MGTLTLDECYRECANDVRSAVGRRITGSSDLADDACAFAWMKAAERWPIEPNPAGWVYIVACRWAFAESAKQRGIAAELLPDADADPLADPQRAAEASEVLEAIGKLGPNQRAALMGRAIGLSYVEIGDAAARRYRWVDRHVNEGRAALRAELGEDR